MLPPCTLFQFLFTPGYPSGGNFTLSPQRYTHSDFCSIFGTSLNFRTLSTPSTTHHNTLLLSHPYNFTSTLTYPLPVPYSVERGLMIPYFLANCLLQNSRLPLISQSAFVVLDSILNCSTVYQNHLFPIASHTDIRSILIMPPITNTTNIG